MAVNNPTTNYGWILPTEGGSNNTWGTELNEMIGDLAGAIESIDEVIAGLQAELDVEVTRISDADERTSQLEASAPRPAYARAYLAADESVGKAVLEKLSLTEDFDKNGMFDTATPTRMTIPAQYDGLFTVRGVVRVPSYSGADNDAPLWYARIVKNGATDMAEARLPFYNDNYDSATGDNSLVVEALVDAVAGDYFELEVYYDYSGPGLTTRSVVSGKANTYFEIYRHRSPILIEAAAASGFGYSAETSTTTHGIALPAENRVAGQTLLIVFSPRANVTCPTPSGYTLLYESGASSAVSDVFVWMRRITSSESGGGSISATTSLSRESVAVSVLLNDAHPTTDPEVAGGDQGSGDFDGTLSITPSWASGEATLYLAVPTWGGPAIGDYDARPLGWTGTDKLPSDPDENLSGTIAGSIGNTLSYLADTSTPTTVPDHTFDPNVSGWGVVIAVRGAELT